jgi:hypothetical protein
MTTDVISVDVVEGAEAQPALPYGRSWLNGLIDLIERSPGSPWLTFLGLAVAAAIVSNLQMWAGGLAPWGEISWIQVGWGLFTIGTLMAVWLFDGIARSAFDTIRPLTSIADDEAARLRYELTVYPAKPALVILVVCIPLTVAGYFGDPAAAGVMGYTPAALVFRGITESFETAVLLVLICQAVRQLRCVRRIHDQVTRIDLFHPRPLYAFSRLTGAIAVALVAVVVFGLVLAPSQSEATSVWYVGWYGLFIGAAVGVFIVPLQGLHGRLVDEKQRLQVDAGDRLQRVLAEMNTEVDAGDLGRADPLNKTLASQLQQRELLASLPTWPWSTTTLRVFVSAILLPLALFLIQRVLTQLV